MTSPNMIAKPSIVCGVWTLLLLVLTTPGNAQVVTKNIALPAFPLALAVNPVTNQVYVANETPGSVTVIDGATNKTTQISADTPNAVAVNPVTNKIYVANVTASGGTVIVIDGATGKTTSVTAGNGPTA